MGHKWPGPIPDEDLEVLCLYPDNTVGFAKDLVLVKALNQLCREHGYGRVPWMAQHIRGLWYDDDGTRDQLVEQKAAQLRLLAGDFSDFPDLENPDE